MNIKKPIINALDSGALDVNVNSLQELKSIFSLLFDHSDDAVVVADHLGHVVYLNQAVTKLTGLSNEQVQGHALADMFEQDPIMRQCSAEASQCIQSEAPRNVHLDTVDDSSVCSEITISPIMHNRQVLGTISIGRHAVADQGADNRPVHDRDVKHRAIYQQALMDSIPFMIWLKDKGGRLLATNRAYAETAGVTDVRSLEGKTDMDLWPEELAKGYMEDDSQTLKSGEPITLVELIKKSQGDSYWSETYKSPVSIGGEVIGTVGYARDISEQKQLFSKISKKEFEYASLVKHLPLTIIRYDTDCRRIFLNIGSANYPAADVDALIGKTPIEAWDANIINMTAEEFQRRLVQVMQQGKPQTFEVRCEVDGKTHVNMINLSPDFDENNQIIGAYALGSDVTEMSQYRQDMEFLAYHDALTALPNRMLLNERLNLAVANGHRFGLMFMDLDYFKEINDTLGHIVGDELLKEASKRISSSVRSDDVVARIGGDEFAILVTDIKQDKDLAVLADNIAHKLSEPFNIDGINFFVTASLGIASYPTDSEEVEDLIKYADTAMYHAKKQGRNNYQFYTPELTQDAMEHLAIATALRYAVQKDELFLLFQPKVDILTGHILGAETLVRWHGKVLGQIQPDKFIPIAEESGLIIDIGNWVLKSSCQAAVKLNQQRIQPLNIAVNVSSKEFIGNNFIENLEQCLTETGCKPEWITLEITESLLLQDTERAMQTLQKIDEMGIKLSIDDFGTGYSALAYLSKFPIKQVKIDRSFVMDICTTQSAATLVKAIIAMTRSLNKELVAEGIETHEQAAMIKGFGCDEAQGYLYSKPIPYADFVPMVQQQVH